MVIGIGTTLKERFLLERELGRGGMGAVYSATDQVLQRNVAIKLLKERSGDEVGKRLRLEAQIPPGCSTTTWCESMTSTRTKEPGTSSWSRLMVPAT